jgi:hypothetical protein
MSPIRALLLCLTTACATPPVAVEGRTVDPFEGEPVLFSSTPIEEVPLGKFLTDISASIQAWSQKTWTATSRTDIRKQNILEHHITQQARRRKDDLLYSLEAGPQHNRIIAAAALGFTRDPEVLSPLLVALEDPDSRVVGNALLGLTVLEHPDTPTERIATILSYDPSPQLRWGAAYCARTLAERGVRDEGLIDAGRSALLDTEPVVRSQCLLLLAIIGDAESLGAMEGLLRDDVPLVAAAAIRSIGLLGENVPAVRGDCARALVSELRTEDHRARERVHRSLVSLGNRDYGNDLSRWRIWALRLP